MIKRPGSRSCRSPLRIEQQGNETNSFMFVEQNCVWHQTVNVQCLYSENRTSSQCFGLLGWFSVSTQEQQGRSQVLIQRLQEDLEHSRVEATDTFDSPFFWLVPSFPNSLPATACAKVKRYIVSWKMLFNKVWSCDMQHNDMCHDVRVQTFFEDVIVQHDCSLPHVCESSCRQWLALTFPVFTKLCRQNKNDQVSGRFGARNKSWPLYHRT